MISVRMMNITRFSIATARKKFAWLCVQSRSSASTPTCRASERATAGRREQVVDLEPHAGDAVDAVEAPRVVEVEDREPAVELVHADLEQPTTLKLLTRGSVPAGVTVPCGVIATTVSPTRTPSARASSAPSTMPNSPALRSASEPRACAADVGDRVLARRVDAAHEHAAVDVAGRQHRLAGDERRGAGHARVAERRLRDALPVGERGHAAHLDVRRDRQDAVAQLLLEAVHHRQHDDQRGDAERDAGHRDQRDERDERVAPEPLRARV
jgi:hypothetical protein